jgi:acetyl/propionyl-CoA carboxylase alpha subunit
MLKAPGGGVVKGMRAVWKRRRFTKAWTVHAQSAAAFEMTECTEN